MAALYLSSTSALATSTRHIDGPFAGIGLAEKAPAISERSLAQLLAQRAAPARNFAQVVAGDYRPSAPALPADESGILVAVEKTTRAGKVERKEAVVSIEDDSYVPSSRSGISISLGDERSAVRVLATSVGLSVQPPAIRIPRAGGSVEIAMDDLTGADEAQPIQIYPRDASRVHWDPASRTLTAVIPDTQTEIYVARAGQLVVVPVTVGNPPAVAPRDVKVASNGRNLALPPELARLPQAASADHASLALSDVSAAGIAAGGSSTVGDAVSIHASSSEASQAAAADSAREIRLRRAAARASRAALQLKAVDERNTATGGAFPVAGVQVYVAGAEFSSISDAHGEVQISDIPGGSSLLVAANDPSGTYVKSAGLISLGEGGKAGGSSRFEKKLVIPRATAFDMWTRMAGLVQSESKGSLCLDFHTAPEASPEGIQVKLDVRAIGPFHFNRDGVIDHQLGTTSSAGRVCYFNVDPGPVNVSAWQGGTQIMAREFPVLAGRHTHEQPLVSPRVSGTYVQFARESSAHEQLGGAAQQQSYVVEDHQDAVLVATTQKLFPAGDNIQGTGSHVSSAGSSEVVYLDNPDFEPSIHRIAASAKGSQVNVLPVLPRGFVQDMAVYADETQEFTEGSVLVEYGDLQGQGSGRISVRLVNEAGQTVSEPWVFSDSPVTKALFFNVPPGIYGLVVESGSGTWVGADVVSVYGEATSIVQVGSKLSAWFNPDAHH
jgi:hypothetical protein